MSIQKVLNASQVKRLDQLGYVVVKKIDAEALAEPIMPERKMRAKVRVGFITRYPEDPAVPATQETITFHGVAANQYPEDGADENNSFARWSPSVSFEMAITNPALIGTFEIGDTFYADFTPAPK